MLDRDSDNRVTALPLHHGGCAYSRLGQPRVTAAALTCHTPSRLHVCSARSAAYHRCAAHVIVATACSTPETTASPLCRCTTEAARMLSSGSRVSPLRRSLAAHRVACACARLGQPRATAAVAPHLVGCACARLRQPRVTAAPLTCHTPRRLHVCSARPAAYHRCAAHPTVAAHRVQHTWTAACHQVLCDAHLLHTVRPRACSARTVGRQCVTAATLSCSAPRLRVCSARTASRHRCAAPLQRTA